MATKSICNKHDTYAYLLFIQGAFGAATIGISVATAYRFYGLGKDEDTRINRFRFLAWFTTFIGSLVAWFFIAGYGIFLDCKESLEDDATNYVLVAMLMYAIIISLVLVLFAQRLVQTFNNTRYQMSKCFQYWVYFVAIVIILAVLTFLIAIIVNYSNDSRSSIVELGLLAAVFIGLFDVLNGWFLLAVFIRKLTKVMASSSGDNNSNGNGTNGDTNKTDGGQSGSELMPLMSKYTILISVAMGSTTIVALFPVILVTAGVHMIHFATAIVIDVFINCLCLMLQFKIFDNYYIKCCGSCHNKCMEKQSIDVNQFAEVQKKSGHGKTGVSQENMLGDDNLQVKVEDQGNNALRM